MPMHVVKRDWGKIGGALPTAVFLGALIFLYLQRSVVTLESPQVLIILNTLFLCGIPLGVAYLAARSHQATGALAFLLVGSGLVVFGVSSLLAGWVMPLAGGPNPTVTLHNLGSLFAGACQLVGAHWFLGEVLGVLNPRPRVWRYPVLYAGLAALAGVTAWLVFQGQLPVFFDPATGPSPLRQVVLGSAILAFGLAALVFVEIYAATRTEFAYWYGLALSLIMLGLICVLVQPSVGSLLGWTGRMAQYVGCVYFILAFVQGRREVLPAGAAPASSTVWRLWPYLEQRVSERTARLTQANATLQAEIHERQRVEAELRLKTDELDAFFNVNLDLLCIADTEGHFRRLNPEWERVLGYRHAALEGMRFLDLVHPDDLPATLAALDLLKTGQMVVDFENRYRCQDGTYRWLEWRARPRGNLIYAAAHDVTERKRIEALLRASEARYRQLVEGIPGSVYEYSTQRGGTFYSAHTETILGYPVAALYANPHLWHNAIHPDDLARVEQVVAGFVQGQPFEIEYRIRDARGQWRWLADRSTSRLAAEGEVIIQGIATDITERKQTEEALRENRQFLADLIELSNALIYVKDRAGRYELINRQWEAVTGLTRARVLGQTDEVLFPGASGQQFRVNDQQVLDAGQVIEVEETLEDSTGRRSFLSLKFPIRTETGAVKALCGVTTEITERKRAEEALCESEARYHQLADEKAELLREVNHRVGNNLALLSALVETETEGAEHPEARAILHQLLARVNSIVEIHRLLQASHWEPLPLDYLVSQIVSEALAGSPLAGRVQVVITPLPASVEVRSKQAANLALMLNELTLNSIKYAFAGRPAGRLEVRLAVSEAGRAHLEFRDDGPGWPPEVLRGERVDVGLELIQSIVRHSWHGEVRLQNDGGAVFVCEFQLV